MKILSNISFRYFELCLGGTIRHVISDFKDQDGSGFGADAESVILVELKRFLLPLKMVWVS